MYTDGSFTGKYGSLTELMHQDPGNNKAHGSVINMDATSGWRQIPVLGLMITGKEIAAEYSYIIKILVLAAGYRLI